MPGVYLGDPDFEKQNCEGVVAKLCARLSKWHWLLPHLSYRGRVLVINNLVASMLWHRLKVLSPPDRLIDNIHKQLVDYFWTGQHWIQAEAVYLPVEEGGYKIQNDVLQTADCPEAALSVWSAVAGDRKAASAEGKPSGL